MAVSSEVGGAKQRVDGGSSHPWQAGGGEDGDVLPHSCLGITKDQEGIDLFTLDSCCETIIALRGVVELELGEKNVGLSLVSCCFVFDGMVNCS